MEHPVLTTATTASLLPAVADTTSSSTLTCGATLPSSSALKALQVPELVQLIQEQLLASTDCSSLGSSPSRVVPPLSSVAALVRSLRVSWTWYLSGRHLVWRSVVWKDSMAGTPQELDMLHHARWIRSLTCCLTSPTMLPFSLRLPRISVSGMASSARPDQQTHGWSAIVHRVIHGCGGAIEDTANYQIQSGQCTDPFHSETPDRKTLDKSTIKNDKQPCRPTTALRDLVVKGHVTSTTLIDLFGPDGVKPGFHPINCLARLTIAQSEDMLLPLRQERLRVDMLKILSALPRLVYLELDLEGYLKTPVSVGDDTTDLEHDGSAVQGHDSLRSSNMGHGLETLRIRRLGLTRPDLEWVLDQCPSLKELATLSVDSQLWQRPPSAVAPALPLPVAVPPHPIPIPFHTANSIGIPQSIPTQDHHHHTDHVPIQPIQALQEDENEEGEGSLVMTLASKCSQLESLQIGLCNGGGLGPLDVQEIGIYLKKLRSLGLAASDCTKDTLAMLLPLKDHRHSHWHHNHHNHHYQQQEQQQQQHQQQDSSCPPQSACKGAPNHWMPPRIQLHHSLTSLIITTACSSEKTSQTILDFMCAATYLQVFEALNTTLYLDHMQPSDHEEGSNSDVHQGAITTPRPRQWACTQLRTLKARFARLPWRTRRPSDPSSSQTVVHAPSRAGSPNPVSATGAANTAKEPNHSSSAILPHQLPQQQSATAAVAPTTTSTTAFSPERNPDLYHFLTPCTQLERLLIKEGLVLQQGREYDSLQALDKLEHLIWTTCYPVPFQAGDMEWLRPKRATSKFVSSSLSTVAPLEGLSSVPMPKLRRVTIRRSKLGAHKDEQAIADWFQRHRPDVEFAFQWIHEWEDDAI